MLMMSGFYFNMSYLTLEDVFEFICVIILLRRKEQTSLTLEFIYPNQTTLLKFQLIYHTISLIPTHGYLIDISNLMSLWYLDSKVGTSESYPHNSCLRRLLPYWVWVGSCDLLNPINAEVDGSSSSPKPYKSLAISAFVLFGAINHQLSCPSGETK